MLPALLFVTILDEDTRPFCEANNDNCEHYAIKQHEVRCSRAHSEYTPIGKCDCNNRQDSMP